MTGCVAAAFSGDPEALQQVLDAAGGGPHTHPISDVVNLQASLDALIAGLAGKQAIGSYAAAVHGHAIADVTGLVSALLGKQDAGSYQPAGSYYTQAEADALLAAKLATSHAGTGGTAHANAVAAGAAGFMTGADKSKLDGIAASATVNSTDAALRDRSTHTNTQSLDTTSDSATRVAMTPAERTKLAGIASAATANSTDAALAAAYRTLLDSSGSHIAGRVAGTYGFGQGDPIAISGTGTLYPLNIIQISAADYPAIGALAAKLRVKATINCNDVAPGHNFVLGLHPVTRPATSGGAGLAIYTIGAAIAGSTVTATTPAADSSAAFTSADFALPADGQYVLGVVTNGTTAVSALAHLSAALQLHHA